MQKINNKLRFKCGVYELFNLVNGKRYVGSSINIYNRLNEHLYNLKNNKAHNKHLQSAWNKYGEENFIYNVLEFCNEDLQFKREQYYIDCIHPEYNLTYNVIANTGHQVSDECKKKISETLKKKYSSGEIHAYRQNHAWIKCYIYNIRTLKLIAECDCLADANRKIKRGHFTGDRAFNSLFKNCYILTKVKFTNKNDLINYINQKFKKVNSKFGKYIIIEKQNKLYYCRTLGEAAKIGLSYIRTLTKHSNASKENPYIIKNSKYLFYYSNEYIPIKGYEAVPVEESQEL